MNTFTGLNNDILANAVLEGFLNDVAPLRAFSTSFSGDAAKRGAKVTVLRIGAQGTVRDKALGGDYTIDGSAADMVEVALDNHKYVSAGLEDIEAANSSLADLEKFGKAKGRALAAEVVAEVLSKVTAANFGAAVFTGVASGFDSDDVIDIRTACNAAKMPKGNRSLILGEDYVGSLLKDSAVKNSAAFGSSEAIKEGIVGRLSGFDVVEATELPDNAENLVGIAAHPAGMAVAMRYLAPQEGHTYHMVQAITDEATGITIGLRVGYDQKKGQLTYVWEAVFGYELGIAAGIKRLISA